jgi:Sulfotransferase domain
VTGSSRLPDFVGIGALKAGTTYLDELLRPHPQLCLPVHLKETNFFSVHYERGPGWYRRQFSGQEDCIRGEFSPSYMSDLACVSRVYDANPEVKIIISLRHPVRRLLSQYRHWVQETGYKDDFATFTRDHPGAVSVSCYHASLAPWLQAFPSQAFFYVVFEELIADGLPVVQKLYRFLGVASDFVPDSLDRAFNVTVEPRFPRSYHLAKQASRALYSLGMGRAVYTAKRLGAGRMLRRGSTGPTGGFAQPAPSVDEATAAVLRADAVRLGDLIGRDPVALWEL